MKALKISLIVLAFIILSLLVKSDIAITNTRDVALVLKVRGAAQQQEVQAKAWHKLLKAARLKSGDKVRTGAESLVAMVFTDDKSMLKIRSDSEIEIGGQRSKKGFAKRLFMEAGDMWAKVTPGGAGFRMETPSGVAAVKGTIFYGSVFPDSTIILGVEGLVQLFNDEGSVFVGKGQRGKLVKNKAPKVVQTAREEHWADEGQGQEKYMDIEFEDDTGAKKVLRIWYKE